MPRKREPFLTAQTSALKSPYLKHVKCPTTKERMRLFGPVSLALSARYPTHYAPSDLIVGDLDQVFNASTETQGGIYNGSYVSPDAYGTYNFCNMPHVRASEYLVPLPDYELQYVEVIHRHHKRTPYQSNTFPEEDMELSCSATENFYYGHSIDRPTENVAVGWANYQDPINPFTFQSPGFNGTCQFPQISNGGLNDSYYHGVDLFTNYASKLQFLPQEYNSLQVQYYVTSNVITSQVAGALIAGMYPENLNVTVNIQRVAVDSLEPQYTCDGAVNTKASIYEEPEWVAHLNRSADLFKQLDAISGVNSSVKEWHVTWDHYFDNLAHRMCHGFDLPCKIGGGDCISETQAFQVFRLGNFEYHYLHRKSENSTLYSTGRYGVFLMQLQAHLSDAKCGSSLLKYRHNVAHDGSVAPLLGALQIDELKWPGMGAEVVFELWKKKDNSFYVRVLYGGKPLSTSGPLGVLDMLPYEKFDAYLSDLVGDNNVVALCNA